MAWGGKLFHQSLGQGLQAGRLMEYETAKKPTRFLFYWLICINFDKLTNVYIWNDRAIIFSDKYLNIIDYLTSEIFITYVHYF